MTTALLIRNPVARRKLSDEQLAATLDIAASAGWRIDSADTDRAGAATTLAGDAAARGIDVVIVYGGDGTINEALNGLAGTNTALAVLRGGTANVWAIETKLPKDPLKAMRLITTGVRRRVDLGRANGRYFLLMCGIGLDAAIVRAVNPRLKRWLGAATYVLTGVAQVLKTRTWSAAITIDADATERSLYFMLVSNTRLYGGVAQITHHAIADDGELDVALMRRGGIINVVRDGARVLLKRHDRSPNVRMTRAHTVEISTPNIPIQLDGEDAGTTPLRIEVAPGALTVIVPRTLRSSLFTREYSP